MIQELSVLIVAAVENRKEGIEYKELYALFDRVALGNFEEALTLAIRSKRLVLTPSTYLVKAVDVTAKAADGPSSNNP